MNVFAILSSVYIMSVGCLGQNPRFLDLNRECFSQEKIYYKPANKCYKLLTKGPCPKGQWFVLEKPKDSSSDYQIRIEGKCVKEKCNDGEYYWAETKLCVKPQDKAKLCGDEKNGELRYNLFGEAECSCTREPPSARLNNDRDSPCHTLYTRGPCRSGEVLGFRNGATDEATCISDPCYYDALQRKRAGLLSQDAILAPWWNNTCYELGTEGPCPKGRTFKVHSKYLTPRCVSLTSAIFDLEQECFRDEMGRCQTEIVTVGNKYKRGIIGALRAARRRRNLNRRRKMRRTDSTATAEETPTLGKSLGKYIPGVDKFNLKVNSSTASLHHQLNHHQLGKSTASLSYLVGLCVVELSCLSRNEYSQVHSLWKRPICVTQYNMIFAANNQNCVMDLNATCQRKLGKKSSGNMYLRELTGILERSLKKREHH